jgi:uncharacterized lipoprotein YddW (UPF0748 family)
MRKISLGNYYKAFDPAYIPHHTPFTDRQLRIVYGEYDQKVRKNEVSVILRKAEAFQDNKITEIVLEIFPMVLGAKPYSFASGAKGSAKARFWICSYNLL